MSDIVYHHYPRAGVYTHHGHGDSEYRHATRPGATRALGMAVFLVLAFACVEFAGGLWSGSLALLADSGHMLTDAASLGFSLAANLIGQRPASARHSYGLVRAEVIAAFVNSLVLLAVVVTLVVLGIDRIRHPVAVNGQAVSVIATGGIVVNLVVAWVLSRGDDNINVRAALLHVMGDLLGSIAALVAGVIIIATGFMVVDPLLSMLVGGLLLRSTFGVLRESTLVLMDSVPSGVDFDEVGRSLAAIPGVEAVHDLHIWSMVPGQEAVSAHLHVSQMQHWPAVLNEARQMLGTRFGLNHVTLQPESAALATPVTLTPSDPSR